MKVCIIEQYEEEKVYKLLNEIFEEVERYDVNKIEKVNYDLVIVNCKKEYKKTKIGCKYMLINSDLYKCKHGLVDNVEHIITYGLNDKSTLTYSSINKEKGEYLISLQRGFKNIKGVKVVQQELLVKSFDKKLGEILLLVGIALITGKKILI